MKNDHDFIVDRHGRKPKVSWDELKASTSEQPIHPWIHTARLERQRHAVLVRQVHEVKLWLDEHFAKRDLPSEFDPDTEHHGTPESNSQWNSTPPRTR